MTVISRLKVDHPPLGTAGGSALHASIQAIYQKIGDNMADRLFYSPNQNDGASVDLDHNFNTAFENLRYDVFGWNEGTGELTLLTASTTPTRAQCPLIAKVGDELKMATLTNNSGSQQDLVVMMYNDVIELMGHDLADVDNSTPIEEGQTYVYDSVLGKMKPGASGDSSFKIQSVATDGTIVIKGGYVKDAEGKEYGTYDGAGGASTDYGKDLTGDLDTLVPSPSNDTTYYVYIDKSLLSDAVALSDNGREVIGVTFSHLVALTTKPKDVVRERYMELGFVRRATGAWSATAFGTLAFRLHQQPNVVISPLVQTFGPTAIGTVGAAGNYAGGHLKDADSYRSSLGASTLSIYALAANPNDAIGTRNFTNNGTTPFTGTDIRGNTNLAANLNGSSHYFTYNADNFFNGGDADFTADIWAAADDWTPGTPCQIMSKGVSSSDRGWGIEVTTTGDIQFYVPLTASTIANTILPNPGFTNGSWHHFAVRYVAATNMWTFFIDGVPFQTREQANLAATSNLFTVGARYTTPEEFFDGRLCQFGYAKAALSDTEVLKLASVRLDLTATVARADQIWEGQYIDANGIRSSLPKAWLIDQKDVKVYMHIGDDSVSTDSVLLKLYDGGLGGATVPVRKFDRTYTSNPGTTVAHGLPSRPTVVEIWHDQNADGKYVNVANDLQAKVDGTNLYVDLSSLTIDGTHPVNIVLSCGVPAIAQETGYKVKSGTYTAVNGDKIITDSSGGAFTVTLPANPGVGDAVEFYDGTSSWGTNAVTVARNGSNIDAAASDLSLNGSVGIVKLVYVNATQGWRVF